MDDFDMISLNELAEIELTPKETLGLFLVMIILGLFLVLMVLYS